VTALKRHPGPLGKASGPVNPEATALIGVAKQIYSEFAKSVELMKPLSTYGKELVWSTNRMHQFHVATEFEQ
jgi:hypothetical protein